MICMTWGEAAQPPHFGTGKPQLLRPRFTHPPPPKTKSHDDMTARQTKAQSMRHTATLLPMVRWPTPSILSFYPFPVFPRIASRPNEGFIHVMDDVFPHARVGSPSDKASFSNKLSGPSHGHLAV
jgi:hypothetical protein